MGAAKAPPRYYNDSKKDCHFDNNNHHKDHIKACDHNIHYRSKEDYLICCKDNSNKNYISVSMGNICSGQDNSRFRKRCKEHLGHRD